MRPDIYQWLWNRLAPMPWAPQSGLSQRQQEITQLWMIFERLNPKTIMEIGVSQGGTFAGWCQLARDDALLIGLDREVNDCRPKHGEQVHKDIAESTEAMTEAGGGMYALKRKGSNQIIVPVRGWSWEPRTIEKVFDALGDRRIDFLFHDASHRAKDTEKDFAIYWPMVATGGMMAFHDIAYSPAPEVDKWVWWRSIRDNGPQVATYSFGLTDRAELSMGIGVLLKGSE